MRIADRTGWRHLRDGRGLTRLARISAFVCGTGLSPLPQGEQRTDIAPTLVLHGGRIADKRALERHAETRLADRQALLVELAAGVAPLGQRHGGKPARLTEVLVDVVGVIGHIQRAVVRTLSQALLDLLH